MEIIKATEKNLNEIFDIENVCFSSPFGKNDINYELSNNPFAYVYLLQLDSKIVGYIDYWITFDSSTICRIAVLPKYRNKGFAQLLLDDAINNLINKKVSTITLEVRESNIPAISLYLKNGFVKITTKPQYYENGENAIYMAKGI